jgi:hypothetical protein
VVKQDPRVKTPVLAMQQVYTLSEGDVLTAPSTRLAAARQARALRDQIAACVPAPAAPRPKH